MELLDSPIRAYAWGSRTVIAAIQGRTAPTDAPEAELWMGAHPDSPSTLRRDGVRVRLDDAIAAAPEPMLGSESLDRFGPHLPFLLKVLAAESPLSLQAHPDAEMARRRYAQEAGPPRDRRLYTDPYAKPELLVALDDFDTLCGFRDPSISARRIGSLGVPALAPVVAMLESGPIGGRLRSAVETLLRWPVAGRVDVIGAVVAAARRRGLDYVAGLGERFPGDLAVVVAMLLNHVTLHEGEAIWMPAGNMHAYLRGTGVEVLASSDNVLRGGLTHKRVDVDELLAVLRYEVLADPVVKPVPLGRGLVTWPVPAAEFSLFRVRPSAGPVALDIDGPRIVFCRSGSVTVDDGTALRLAAGQAAYGSAGRPLSVDGDGTAFVATIGS